MARLYLDSNVVISLVEEEPRVREILAGRLADLGGVNAGCVISDLVYLECLVKPLAIGDSALLEAYEAYVSTVDVVALTRAVCRRAAAIRATHRYQTPDALHLAAAVEAGCDSFVTADARLAGFPGIPVVLLERA